MRARHWLIVYICLLTIGHIPLQANFSTIDSTLTTEELNDLEIQISCEKEEFIQGESIDILIKINNNTNDTISVSPKYYLYDLNSDSTFTSSERGIFMVPPMEDYYYLLDPSEWLLFMGRMDISTFTLKSGNYAFYMSASLSNEKYLSNKLIINVNPVPDSLQKIFNDLKYDKNSLTTIESAEQLLEKNKNTFYEINFYRKVFNFSSYYYAIQNKDNAKDYRKKAVKLHIDFILKYPNTSTAYESFRLIMSNYTDNQTLIEDILTSLKKNQSDCKLLEVLGHNPYLSDNIKNLLN